MEGMNLACSVFSLFKPPCFLYLNLKCFLIPCIGLLQRGIPQLKPALGEANPNRQSTDPARCMSCLVASHFLGRIGPSYGQSVSLHLHTLGQP